MITKIFVDMDDVLNYFTMSALRYIGCDVEPWNYGAYNPVWGWNILHASQELKCGKSFRDYDDFWGRFPRSFWASVPVSNMCYPLLELCDKYVGHDNVAILTRPTNFANCYAGKFDWIERHIPDRIKNCFIGGSKHLCANHESLLIDDNEENVNLFCNNGGHTILVPRPWNRNYIHFDSFGEVKKCLSYYVFKKGNQ